jgi:uncharacterized protein
MLMVKTRLGMSPIEGMGVFADQFIPKGTTTWKFIPEYDQLLSPETVANAVEPIRTTLMRYSYLDSRTGLYIFCVDNGRFVNHSDTPNTRGHYESIDAFGRDVATRDIQIGEELTCDYREFDLDHKLKLGTP